MIGPGRPTVGAVLLAGLLAVGLLAGCGQTGRPVPRPSIPAGLLAGLRPIGRGVHFHPPVRGRPTGGCRSRPGPHEAHLELFAADRVLLIPAGVGHRDGCWGEVTTRTSTGVIHFRAGATIASLFAAWGEPFGPRRLASFAGPVRAYVAGRRVGSVPALTDRAEIVLEVGPYVPPHRTFRFAPGE